MFEFFFCQRCKASSPGRPLEVEEVLKEMNYVLFVELGFHGNHDNYYDPANSYLHKVMQRKCGIPISLSVLYMCIGARLGLKMVGESVKRDLYVGKRDLLL